MVTLDIRVLYCLSAVAILTLAVIPAKAWSDEGSAARIRPGSAFALEGEVRFQKGESSIYFQNGRQLPSERIARQRPFCRLLRTSEDSIGYLPYMANDKRTKLTITRTTAKPGFPVIFTLETFNSFANEMYCYDGAGGAPSVEMVQNSLASILRLEQPQRALQRAIASLNWAAQAPQAIQSSTVQSKALPPSGSTEGASVAPSGSGAAL